MNKIPAFFLVLLASLFSIYLQVFRTNQSPPSSQPTAQRQEIPQQIPQEISQQKISSVREVAEREATEVQPEVQPAVSVKKPIDPLSKFDPERSKELTDIAKFLAGIKVEKNPEVSVLQEDPNWINYANFMNGAWSKLEAKQLSAARRWSGSELKSINGQDLNVFYPFSGPDFLYAHTFFNRAPKYILAGLEPIGRLPKFSNVTQANQQIQGVQQSLYTLLQYSFFRTIDMRSDLRENGVLPLLYVFLARTNHTLLDVKYIGLNKEGELIGLYQQPQSGSEFIPGVQISFLSLGDSQPKTLYYFAVDLSDSELQKTPEFMEFIGSKNLKVTYLKAASYLMHRDTFSTIRNFILQETDYVLQDDSGIPVRYFEATKWTRQFYGSYVKPIDLFAVRYQPDLRQIYQNNANLKNLGFGIGYKFDADANLMLAISKDRVTQSGVKKN